VIVAVATTLIFWSLGVWQAAIWGVAAGVLNIFPYIGPALVTAAAGVSGYVQFGAISTALLVAGAATAVASIEGFLITPWLMGRAGRVSPVAIFVGASFGGWLWGIAGLLLAIPLLMVAKAICDHIERLRFVGELLAD
jgi:predicted PurR-regulated permease PerM